MPRVRMIREREIQGAGPMGPLTRTFVIGEVVDLPEIHALMFVGGGDAVMARDDERSTDEAKPRRRTAKD